MEVGERDPVTGQLTTGHEWNGIKELYTPVPRVVIFFLVVTTLFAVGYWILMPAWPLGQTYTKGLLGIDQKTTVERQVEEASAERAVWTKRIDEMDFAAIKADPALMEDRARSRSARFSATIARHATERAARGARVFPT